MWRAISPTIIPNVLRVVWWVSYSPEISRSPPLAWYSMWSLYMLAFIDRYQIRMLQYLKNHGIFFFFFVSGVLWLFLHAVAAVSVMCVYTLVLCAVIAMQSRRVCICSIWLSVCVSGVGGSKDSALCMCVSACLFGLMVSVCVCVCEWLVLCHWAVTVISRLQLCSSCTRVAR